MSTLWHAAMHKAYPYQTSRLRPSGIANCALQQAAGVAEIPRTNEDYATTWQAELGRAGQEVALTAFPHLGFEVTATVNVEGMLPGEMDAILRAKPHNLCRLPEDTLLVGDVKLRNCYAYCHIWSKSMDLLEIDQGVATQMNTYMGESHVSKAMIILLPFDTAAVRNELRWNAKRVPNPDLNPYLRLLVVDFNPGLFALTAKRKAEIQMYGVDVAPEYDPRDGKFPCTYCDWLDWCSKRGGGVEVTQLPSSGMPITEVYLP